VSVNEEPGQWIPQRSPGQTTGTGPSGRRLLITAVAIALLAGIAAHLLSRREELAYVQRLSSTVLLTALGCQFLSQLFWNEAMLVPLRAYMKLGYWELFMVRSGGFLVGALVPVAGNLAVRMAYLKRRGLTYSDFAWATMVSNIVALLAAAVLAVMAVGTLWMVTGALPSPVLVLTAAVLGLGLTGVAALRVLPRLAGHSRFQRWRWLSGMSSHRAGLGTLTAVLGFSFARHAFSFISFGVLYQALARAPSGFLTGGLVYAITSPIRIVTITPGNLGVNEWVVAAVGKLLSFDLTTGLIVALVFRGLSLAAQGLGVLLAAAWVGLRGQP